MSTKRTPVKSRSTKVEQVVSQGMLVASHHQIVSVSPLPPPNELERYEKLYPGIAKKFIELTEAQQNHRMELENKAIDHDIRRTTRGQYFAFILSLVCMLGGMFLLYKGIKITGLALVISPLVALTGSFIYGKKTNKAERIEKSKKNPPDYQ